MPFLFFKNYWKSIVVMLAILILSTITFSTIPDVAKFEHSDKIAHVVMYCGLGIVLFADYTKDYQVKNKYAYWKWYLLLFAVLWGGVIELIQFFFTAIRTAELADWVADIIGLILGFLFALGVKKIICFRKK